MKKLNQFLFFDTNKFLEAKKLYVVGTSPITDNENVIGTKIQVVIFEDKTTYRCAEGETVTNQFEKFNIKVKKAVDIPIGAIVSPVNPVGTLYGEYRNNLSVSADDIKIIK
ncbi:MAG: hypothetical protein IJ851_05260 [Eubacterium sp.]|nr:hypothetical protein [Eubacterium sp.]